MVLGLVEGAEVELAERRYSVEIRWNSACSVMPFLCAENKLNTSLFSPAEQGE